jgi:hypothetical protein
VAAQFHRDIVTRATANEIPDCRPSQVVRMWPRRQT